MTEEVALCGRGCYNMQVIFILLFSVGFLQCCRKGTLIRRINR